MEPAEFDEERFDDLTRSFYRTRRVPTIDELYPCRIYVCETCGSNRSFTYSLQTRSIDEGVTLKIFFACGHRLTVLG